MNVERDALRDVLTVDRVRVLSTTRTVADDDSALDVLSVGPDKDSENVGLDIDVSPEDVHVPWPCHAPPRRLTVVEKLGRDNDITSVLVPTVVETVTETLAPLTEADREAASSRRPFGRVALSGTVRVFRGSVADAEGGSVDMLADLVGASAV